ncbi:hypothetical protein [Plantactinospora sp. GCM10030261]|uniref:hypothetical protein n=1 Tax=Plantactinospora sp. GCM10030261 TaxID=3273420 RepID=UPI003621BDAF
MRRRQALITLGGSLATLGGCAAVADSAGPSPTSNAMEPQVDIILDRRTRALVDGDEDAWLSAVDASNPALVARDRITFANLRQLKPAIARYRRLATPPTAASPGRYASSLPRTSATYEVELAIQLPEVDSAPAAVRLRYVFGRVDDTVTLVDVARPVGADPTEDQPWDSVPLRIHRRAGVLLAAQSGVTGVDALLTAATRAAREVRRAWVGNPASEAFAIFVAADRAAYRSWYGGLAPSWSDGITVPAPRADGDTPDGRFAGVRVAVRAEPAGGSAYNAIKRQLGYALSVAMLSADPELRALPGPAGETLNAPLWAVEGFAAYLVARDSASARQRLRTDLRAARRATDQEPALPANTGFYADGAREANAALGCSVYEFVAERHGHDRAVALHLAAITRRTPDPQPPAAALTAALTAAGLIDDPAATAFAAQWRRYVQRA